MGVREKQRSDRQNLNEKKPCHGRQEEDRGARKLERLWKHDERCGVQHRHGGGCDAPKSIASGAMPVFAAIALRTLRTVLRSTAIASSPTSAARAAPSSKTAARTLHGSWTTLW